MLLEFRCGHVTHCQDKLVEILERGIALPTEEFNHSTPHRHNKFGVADEGYCCLGNPHPRDGFDDCLCCVALLNGICEPLRHRTRSRFRQRFAPTGIDQHLLEFRIVTQKIERPREHITLVVEDRRAVR